MKKLFKNYLVVWAILLVIFNVIAFVSVGWAGYEKYTASFWIGYVFITIAFIGQIVCAYIALKDDDLKKTFYNLPLITTSYTGLILSFIFGGLCMLISPLPYWVGIILCCIVLALNAITVVKSAAAAEIVSSIDTKVKQQTFFIRSLTVDADGLVARAKSEEIKAVCKKVYEAVRYSDPMSSDALAAVENDISLAFADFANAVAQNDQPRVIEAGDNIIALLKDRNNKCKMLK